jgi:hypothetical protein
LIVTGALTLDSDPAQAHFLPKVHRTRSQRYIRAKFPWPARLQSDDRVSRRHGSGLKPGNMSARKRHEECDNSTMDDYPPNVDTETFRRTERERLRELRVEHRELDEAIQRMQEDPLADELQLRRLKKHKLRLKDLIAQAESALIPDLDA